MDDQLTIIFVAVTFLFLILAFIGRRKNDTTRSKWRTLTAASLWAINAMLFGGVSTPVEKGKVTNVRTREIDEEDDAIGN